MAGKPSSITERAISQAIAFLRTSGCTFIIHDADGNEIANTIPKGKYNKTGVHYKPHFKPFIDALNGEGMVDIEIPEEFDDPVRYRGALAGYLHSEFGSGGYITSLDGRTVSVIVVGGKGEDENLRKEYADVGVDIDAAHKQEDKGTVTLPIDEPKQREYVRPQFQRSPRPLNPVLTSEIVEALQVPDFGKPE